MASKDIILGADGYYQNVKYVPDIGENGYRFYGYRTSNERALFFYFAVQGYDLQFKYNGKWYYFLSEPDYVALTDSSFSHDIVKYGSANEMFETFMIDGKRLIDLVNDLQDVDVV